MFKFHCETSRNRVIHGITKYHLLCFQYVEKMKRCLINANKSASAAVVNFRIAFESAENFCICPKKIDNVICQWFVLFLRQSHGKVNMRHYFGPTQSYGVQVCITENKVK
jgi:hypothetical protein